ncbi:MAG: hypothetical protein Q7S92_02705 [Candidatus Diapherotrites archaeon]|nr:hypothetical protein [Candidatus Diapherotrites archaeon]
MLETDFVEFFDLNKLKQIQAFLGNSKIVVLKTVKVKEEIKDLKEQFPKLEFGTWINSKNERMIQSMGSQTKYLVVPAETLQDYQFSVNHKQVQFIVPNLKRKLELDLQLAGLLGNAEKIILIPFSEFLTAKPFERAKMIENFKKLSKICKKAKIEMHWISLAQNEYDLRNMKDFKNLESLIQK